MSRHWTADLLGMLWRSYARRVRVYVGAERVAVDLVAARSARLLKSATRAIAAGDDAAAAAADALAQALQTLAAEVESLRGVGCDLVLADNWVVYDVVALDLVRVSDAAAQTAIAAALGDIAGLAPQSLAVRWQAQDGGRSAFAIGVPRALLEPLLAQMRAFGLRPRTATGEFVSVFNAQRRTLRGRRAVLAVARDAGAQIAVLIDGAIAATRYEIGRCRASALTTAAANAMRARGADTTAPIDYVLDAGHARPDDVRWRRVPPPVWARQRGVA